MVSALQCIHLKPLGQDTIMTTLAEKIARNIAAADIAARAAQSERKKQKWIKIFTDWQQSIIDAAETATKKDFFTSVDIYELIKYDTNIIIGVYEQTIPLSKFERDEYTKEPFFKFKEWLKSENLVCKFVVGESFHHERNDKISDTEVYMVVAVAD